MTETRILIIQKIVDMKRFARYNFKNVKNLHGGMLLYVKFLAEAGNFTTKSNTPS